MFFVENYEYNLMNWYKTIIKLCQQLKANEEAYTSIGHDFSPQAVILSRKPNFLPSDISRIW